MTHDRRMRGAGGLALCLVLGACATTPVVPPPPTTQGAPRAGVVVPPARGVTSFTVRTSTDRGEVASARCELTSPYTSARFTTPATVTVPDLGSATPPVTVSCASGNLRGSAQGQPAARMADTGMSGWPAIGVSVGAGGGDGGFGTGVSLGGFWNGGSGNGNWTEVAYPDLLVTLR